jgi:hypothetical protein
MAKVVALKKTMDDFEIEEGKKVQENSILLMLSFSMPGLSRSVSRDDIADRQDSNADDFAVSIDADTEMVKVSKVILNSPEYKAIRSHVGATKRAIARIGFRAIFKDACVLLPSEPQILEEVDTFVEERMEEFFVLKDAFVKVYPKQREDAKRLRALYDKSEYPSTSAMNAAFKVTKRYFTFDTPNSLKTLNKKIYDREEQRTKEFWAETASKVEGALITSFSDLMKHALSKMTGAQDGKQKVLTDAALQRIESFLNVFEKRNITGSGQLSLIVDQARKVVKGVDAKAIREEGQVAKAVKEGFESVKKQLDDMLVDRPSRKIRL